MRTLTSSSLTVPDVQISRFRFFMEELCSRGCSDGRSGLPAEGGALGVQRTGSWGTDPCDPAATAISARSSRPDGRTSLESVRGLYQGLHSFRNMRRMEASLRKARALRLRFSQSLASRRQRFNQAIVRSPIQRLGNGTNPLARSERLTISVLRLGKTLPSAVSKIGPA